LAATGAKEIGAKAEADAAPFNGEGLGSSAVVREFDLMASKSCVSQAWITQADPRHGRGITAARDIQVVDKD
jgi:hypothetical protein